MTKKISLKNFFGFIAPRPTVCVSTIDKEGNPNIAPYSFVSPLSFNPPLIGISSADNRDTTANFRETEEFVVAPVTERWMEKGVETEISLPKEESEFDEIGLNKKESKEVLPPSVEESVVNIECEYYKNVELGDHALLVGKVVHVEVDEDAVKDGRLDIESHSALGHVKGEDFSLSDSILKIER